MQNFEDITYTKRELEKLIEKAERLGYWDDVDFFTAKLNAL